ncbi:MAG: hypothetical protein A4E23_00716 [Methanomethylovorans sp. PtaU1.Bin073]|jgi:hypothetical protein|nr:MAG: hypothetical protein A4E23_00716 [Methanomethylovorans sp. PtaU1.Bin073]
MEVPNATTVNPITNDEIPKCLARADAPSTNQSAPLYKNARPIRINM